MGCDGDVDVIVVTAVVDVVAVAVAVAVSVVVLVMSPTMSFPNNNDNGIRFESNHFNSVLCCLVGTEDTNTTRGQRFEPSLVLPCTMET